MKGRVTSVSRGAKHEFTKNVEPLITLIAGFGVEGDVHGGATVKHQYNVRHNATEPNLRQVHLMHAELHDELATQGFSVSAGELGENVTTRGVPLLDLPTGTRLRLGATAVVELTGLRTPCFQVDRFQKGLLAAVVGRDESGRIIRKTGVMSVVLEGGDVGPGDRIEIELPAEPHMPLEPV